MKECRQIKSPILFVLCVLLGFILSITRMPDVHASDFTEKAGDIVSYVLPAAAAGMTLAHKDGEGALQLGESAALTLGVTYGLKYSVDEERPNGGSHSFPSLHSSVSFFAAEFMRKRYGWEYGVPAYLAATFVAYSRVESDEHYTRDVLAGAAIGVLSSYMFTSSFNNLLVQPEANGKYLGARLTYYW